MCLSSDPVFMLLQSKALVFTRPTFSHVLLLVCATLLASGRRTITAAERAVGRGVLLLEMVDNSLSPCKLIFRLVFSSFDSTEKVLDPVGQRSCPRFDLHQAVSRSFTGRLLT